jgi:hypothetical protein
MSTLQKVQKKSSGITRLQHEEAAAQESAWFEPWYSSVPRIVAASGHNRILRDSSFASWTLLKIAPHRDRAKCRYRNGGGGLLRVWTSRALEGGMKQPERTGVNILPEGRVDISRPLGEQEQEAAAGYHGKSLCDWPFTAQPPATPLSECALAGLRLMNRLRN